MVFSIKYRSVGIKKKNELIIIISFVLFVIEKAMNLLDMLQEYTTQIMDDPCLTGKQQEEKIIQIFDLCHFVEIYKRSLRIIDFDDKVNIIEDDGGRKGIYFCDLLYTTTHHFEGSLYSQSFLQSLKRQSDLSELWFVVVEENFISENMNDSKAFIKKNKVEDLYDRIFYFNYSRSIIKKIN
ncbi:hypothetical protein [Chryseobacterium sp. GP-SGM7]|uniref:hypothetical protein n=1 Tax=Chryseobacterium sp. GP-SGM7 TaxID=3411323 RepID=UPI00068961DE